jgi:hypothetical protein
MNIARWIRLDKLIPDLTAFIPLGFLLPTFTMKVFSLDTDLESDAASRAKAARRSRNAIWGKKK